MLKLEGVLISSFVLSKLTLGSFKEATSDDHAELKNNQPPSSFDKKDTLDDSTTLQSRNQTQTKNVSSREKKKKRDGDTTETAREKLKRVDRFVVTEIEALGTLGRNDKTLTVIRNPYKGVSYDRTANSYRCKIKFHGRTWYLGVFKDAIKGAKAYDNAAHFLNCKDRLNWPQQDDCYNEEDAPKQCPKWLIQILLETPIQQLSDRAKKYIQRVQEEKEFAPQEN
jgi:hypothetical protein